jgi:Fe-S-cluster containining protein
MGDSTSKIPQLVPSQRCFSCDICCRFPEKDSFLRPFFTQQEIKAAINAGVPSEFFPDLNGSQINLIPNPQPGAEGYICPCFDPENGHCKIYEVRPLDCQLYPVALMQDKQGHEVVIGLDTKCPYVQERRSDAAMSDYIQRVAALLDSSEMIHRICDNASLVQRYQDDVMFVLPLEGLSRRLKGLNR